MCARKYSEYTSNTSTRIDQILSFRQYSLNGSTPKKKEDEALLLLSRRLRLLAQLLVKVPWYLLPKEQVMQNGGRLLRKVEKPFVTI